MLIACTSVYVDGSKNFDSIVFHFSFVKKSFVHCQKDFIIKLAFLMLVEFFKNDIHCS